MGSSGKLKNMQILSNRWVFRRKFDGSYKARLVIRGCEGEGVFGPYEVYAPVAKINRNSEGTVSSRVQEKIFYEACRYR